MSTDTSNIISQNILTWDDVLAGVEFEYRDASSDVPLLIGRFQTWANEEGEVTVLNLTTGSEATYDLITLGIFEDVPAANKLPRRYTVQHRS